jgi:hypothetical protein
MQKIFLSFTLYATLILFPFNTIAAVLIYDDITSINKPVRLKARTKGRFFPEGGKLVKFFINGKHIGTVLSGGDGYAFLKYTPLSSGIKTLSVREDSQTDKGVLLVTRSKDRVLIIEIEAALFSPKIQSLFTPAKDSREALVKLSDKYRILYVTAMVGVRQSKDWLNKNKFPVSAVLKWQGSSLLDELKKRDIHIYAVIGSPELINNAMSIKKRFSFHETENAKEIKDWKEMLTELLDQPS